jgi:hypothetical protein
VVEDASPGLAARLRRPPGPPRRYGGDNSFFRDDKANITLGKGGVDDAEDAEVIVHEYGHSVQDSQVPGFGTISSPARSAKRSPTTWPWP